MRPPKDCKLCSLSEGRTNIVMPHGDTSSGIVFVGEAPGENEDIQGIPFIGRAGKELDRYMEAEGLQRSKVVITNAVKCRPPGNRDPTDEEMSACRKFLDYELSQARLVIGLGKSACKSLTGYNGRMADIVNKRTVLKIDGKEIPFIPTYHPQACIYSKDARPVLRETMRIVREELETME